MTDKAHLQLFYTNAAQSPQRFFELRRYGKHVWHAQGAVHTWGAADSAVCETDEDAKHLAAGLAQEMASQSFELLRDVTYSPEDFDYAAFTEETTRGVELYWTSLKATHPETHFDRCALLTDSDLMTICCVANASSTGDSEEVVYNPSEWKHEEMGELDIAYRLILSKHRSIPFETRPPHHSDNLLECMIRSLQTLRGKSVFDANTLLWVEISDDDQVAGMFERLNTPWNVAQIAAFYGPSTRVLETVL